MTRLRFEWLWRWERDDCDAEEAVALEVGWCSTEVWNSAAAREAAQVEECVSEGDLYTIVH